LNLTIWFKEIKGGFNFTVNKIEIPDVTHFRLDNDLLRWETEYGFNYGTLIKNVRYFKLEDECQKKSVQKSTSHDTKDNQQ
jgi:hypothetical protein